MTSKLNKNNKIAQGFKPRQRTAGNLGKLRAEESSPSISKSIDYPKSNDQP